MRPSSSSFWRMPENDDPMKFRHNGSGMCKLKVFTDHTVPQPSIAYFTPSSSRSATTGNDREEHLLVCIPAYNEEADDLLQTLQSLYDQMNDMPGVRCSVCVILDGWAMASNSMKLLMANMMQSSASAGGAFGSGSSDCSSDESPAIQDSDTDRKSGSSTPRGVLTPATSVASLVLAPTPPLLAQLNSIYSPGLVATVVVENIDPETQEIVPVEIQPGKWMEVTFVVKTDNRKKHNSHQWFMAGFGGCHERTATYLFMTDTGTYYSPKCLEKLIRLLRDKPDEYCAACAFQRPAASRASMWNLTELFHAYAQRYEFYNANYGTAAAFALVSFQPIIPGPCQVFTASAGLNPEFQRMYYEIGNMDPSEFDFITANMQLAEDRFFTNYIYTTSSKKIGFVPDAIFHYELEVEPKDFINQRRRWNNGTIAASIRLLQDYPVWSATLPKGTARLVYASMVFYLMTIAISFVTPGMFCGGMVQAFGLKINKYLGYERHYQQTLSTEALLLTVLFALLFLAVHTWFTLVHHKSKFNRVAYEVNQYVNIILMALIVASSINDFNSSAGSPGAVIYMAITGLGFIFPAAMSMLIKDWKGLLYGSVCFIPYLLFKANFCLAFAFGASQCWNLSWGTRPTERKSKTTKAYDVGMAKIYKVSRALMWSYLIVNYFISIAMTVMVYYFATFLVLATFIALAAPTVLWYPFAMAFFMKYAKDKFVEQHSGLMRFVPFASRKKMMAAVAMVVLAQFGMMNRTWLLANDTSRYSLGDSRPFLEIVKICEDLACVRHAHMTAATNMTSTQFNFPHAMLLGYQEAGATFLQDFINKHDQAIKSADGTPFKSTDADYGFFTLECKANPNACPSAAQSEYIKDVLHRDAYVNSQGNAMTYEMDTHYAMNGHHLAAGIKEQLPWVKIVATLREPITRALSRLHRSAQEQRELGCLNRRTHDLFHCLLHESQLSPRFGPYNYLDSNNPSVADSLEHWVAHFTPEQLHVMQWEQISAEDMREQVLSGFEKFLGLQSVDQGAIPEFGSAADDAGTTVAAAEKFTMPKDKYEKLIEHARPDAEAALELLANGGYISSAREWMENWERVWSATLQSCDARSNVCVLNF